MRGRKSSDGIVVYISNEKIKKHTLVRKKGCFSFLCVLYTYIRDLLSHQSFYKRKKWVKRFLRIVYFFFFGQWKKGLSLLRTSCVDLDDWTKRPAAAAAAPHVRNPFSPK